MEKPAHAFIIVILVDEVNNSPNLPLVGTI